MFNLKNIFCIVACFIMTHDMVIFLFNWVKKMIFKYEDGVFETQTSATIDELVEKLKKEYNNGDIKITHLPMLRNPDDELEKAIERKYGKECPCCHSTKVYEYTSYYCDKRFNQHFWEIWKPIHRCKQIEYKCPSCNTRWKTPWFPQDLEKKVFEK